MMLRMMADRLNINKQTILETLSNDLRKRKMRAKFFSQTHG
jgi:hypothetical protein